LEIDKISSIGRPLDFNYKTNKAIAIITAITITIGIVLAITKQLEIPNVILLGLSFGITFFLSWAISREIDPDNAISAFIGLIPLFFSLFFWSETNIVILLWLLISLRIINRTTGLPARFLDSAMLFAISVLLISFYNSFFGFLTTIVFLLDTTLIDGQKFQLLFASLSTLSVFIFVIINNQIVDLSNFSMIQSISILTISIMFIFIVYFTRDIKSKGDKNHKTLHLSRIKATQLFALLSVLLVSLTEFGLTAMIPVWCVLIGVIVQRISSLFKE